MADPTIGALQGALSVMGHYKRRVDGLVGPETDRSIRRDPVSARKWANTLGGSASDLVESVLSPKARTTGTSDEVIAVVTSVAREFGVLPSSALAKGFIESGLRPDAKNEYGFAGLFQMGKSAWTDARGWLRRNGREDIGEYDANKFDLRQNSRAAFAYRYALIEQLEAKGEPGPHTEAILYLAHQQGAAGYARLARAARSGIVPTGDNSDMANAMKKNPPQDGKGVTYDPALFIARWEDVFDLRARQHA